MGVLQSASEIYVWLSAEVCVFRVLPFGWAQRPANICEKLGPPQNRKTAPQPNPKGPKIEKNQSLSIEIFNPGPSEFPTKKNRGLVGGSLDNFNLDWKFQSRRAILNFFNLWALREIGQKYTKISKIQSFVVFLEYFCALFWGLLCFPIL